MEYAAADLSPRERYKLLTSFVLPRPIAWVTSVGPTGVVNAAPFSFFNVLCEDPPPCIFAVNNRSDGSRIRSPIPSAWASSWSTLPTNRSRRRCTKRAATFRPTSASRMGLKLAPSTAIAVPRLADTPWAMECKIWKVIDVNGDRRLVMGEGVHFHVRDELWDGEAMRVHMERYHPVGACSRTATAARMIAWSFRRPKERKRR
jgi:flavin reductase (DIM6/NTAB) family NADH-FMN oxidoreductase RutF